MSEDDLRETALTTLRSLLTIKTSGVKSNELLEALRKRNANMRDEDVHFALSLLFANNEVYLTVDRKLRLANRG